MSIALPVRATNATRRRVFDRDDEKCTTCGFGCKIGNPLVAITLDDESTPCERDVDSFRTMCLECATIDAGLAFNPTGSYPVGAADVVTTWSAEWASWSYRGEVPVRDDGWASSLGVMLVKGANPLQLVNVIEVPMRKNLRHGSQWRYFCGCIHKSLASSLPLERSLEVVPSLPRSFGSSVDAMVQIANEFRLCIECLAMTRFDDHAYANRATHALFESHWAHDANAPICAYHVEEIRNGAYWDSQGIPSDARMAPLPPN